MEHESDTPTPVYDHRSSAIARREHDLLFGPVYRPVLLHLIAIGSTTYRWCSSPNGLGCLVLGGNVLPCFARYLILDNRRPIGIAFVMRRD